MSSALPIALPRGPNEQQHRAFQLDDLSWAHPTRLPEFEELLDPNFMFAVAQWLRRHGGPAAGPDGTKWEDLSAGETWGVIRDLRCQLQDRHFQPSAARLVRLRKADGSYRVLKIRDLPTRLAEKLLQLGLNPYFESIFSPDSFGFRPHIGPWHLLASLIRAVEQEQFTYLAQADIRKAFDCLSPDTTLQDFSQRVQEEHMLQLIGTFLQKDNVHGVDQGGSLSPLALNTHLNALDWQLSSVPGYHRRFRYADNYFCVGKSGADAGAIIDIAAEWLKERGLTLKQEGRIRNLATGNTTTILGFDVQSVDNRIALSPGARAWEHLAENLAAAWHGNVPNDLATRIALGWVEYFAPCIENCRESLTDRALRKLAEAGFRAVDRGSLEYQANQAYRRWTRLKRGQTSVTVAATPPAVAILENGSVILTGAEFVRSAPGEVPF